MENLFSLDVPTIKYLIYMFEETNHMLQVKQETMLAEAFGQKIRNYNRQELLFAKASLIAYRNIEKNNSGQLTNQYLQVLNKQLKTFSIADD